MPLECSTNFRRVQSVFGISAVFASLTYSNLNSTEIFKVC